MKKRIFTRYHFIGFNTFQIWLMLLGMLFYSGNLISQCEPVIVGDALSCSNSQGQYELTGMDLVGLDSTTDVTWSISGGGVLNPTNGLNVTVDWSVAGFRQLYVAISPNGNCASGQFDTLDVYVSGNGAPQMNCNDTVQVSLGIDCEALVTLDMVYEGDPMFPEEAVEIIIYKEGGDTLPDNILTRDHINMNLIASIRHICSGNTCSGVLIVEDKLPPDALECTLYEIECDDDPTPTIGGIVGFPLPAMASDPVQIGPQEYLVSGIDACSDVILTYEDTYVPDTCPNIGIIYRDWVAFDGGSGMSICTDTIIIKTGVIDGTIWPLDWTGLPGDNPILECDGNWPKKADGHPHEDHTGAPFGGVICSNIDISYNDLRLDICESSYKLLREWIAVDWCHDTIAYHTQIIKVLDEEGPILNCTATCNDPILVSTVSGTCVGKTFLPVPVDCQDCGIVNVVSECSSWTYSVKYIPAIDPSDCGAIINTTATPVDYNIRQAVDEVGAPIFQGGRVIYEVFNLPAGYSWIEYTITDGCGNSSTCSIEIKVEENEKPIAVCDLHTVVTLTNDGTAKAYAETFDDGSHDNCQLGGFEVRRMNPSNCDDTDFKDHVNFCCEDILNNPIMIVFRVYDATGNFNECMVEVSVQDETLPVLSCPRNASVYCGTDLSDLSIFGEAITSDDCQFTTDYVVTNQLTDCGTGEIHRDWWLNKGLVSEVHCRQTIFVTQDPSFDFAGIIWPLSPYAPNNGCLANLDPDDLPSGFKRPDVSNIQDDCHKLYVSHKDKVYNIVQGACFKILRTWTVHDDCSNKTIEHVQVIKVLNSIDPVISCQDSTSAAITGGDCSTYIELTASATDSCTNGFNLKWSYQIDLNSDGTIDATGNTNNASGIYDYGINGNHKVTFRVEDQCGNSSTCTTKFTLIDKKKPTPYCRNGIVTVVMEVTGEVELWASDFNIGSFDNCTNKNDLSFYFRSNNQPNRVFSCSDIANGQDTMFEIDVVVRDLAGNEDYCTTTIILQDNKAKACDDNLNVGTVAGLVQTTNTNMVSEVEVMLDGNLSSGNQYFTTLNDGHFAFPSIPLKSQYRVVPTKNDDYTNGVSTRDLVAIQKHLLGISTFNTPYQFIAADANNSKSISTRDIADLRKLILGRTSKLTNNKSWRFINKTHVFSNPEDPYVFNESIDITSLDGNDMHNDFYAIKIGDVNGDARANNAEVIKTREAGETIYMEVQNVVFSANEDIKVLITSSEFNIEGLQFTLNFDVQEVDLLNINPLLTNMDMSHFGLTEVGEGYVRCSWNDNISNEDIPLFELTFHTKTSGELKDIIRINGDKISSEAYDFNGEITHLALRFKNESGDEIDINDQFALLQNKPNPFDQSTIVAFILPKEDIAQLKIYDVTGKVIKLIKGRYGRGYNEIKIDKKDLSTKGVLYYQLETREHTATKKMILMD